MEKELCFKDTKIVITDIDEYIYINSQRYSRF